MAEGVLLIRLAPGKARAEIEGFTAAQLIADAKVYSCDIHENRVRLIEQGARRLGLSNIKAAVNDSSAYSRELPQAETVLCDVPCSGLGVIRRKPEIKYKSSEELAGLAGLQTAILKNASAYVKSGGRLVYSTCTLAPEENEEVVSAFLEQTSEFSPETIPGESSHMKTFFPDKDAGDGFFMAFMTRS